MPAVVAVVWDRGTGITRNEPGVGALSEVLGVLRAWQDDGAPMQLRPGDLGWFWRSGAEATAAAVRTWSRDGRILAVGLLDGPGLVRLTVAPDATGEEALARQVADDLTRTERGVLPEGEASVEAPEGALVHDLLSAHGWYLGEPWTPLRRDLADPVDDPGVRVEVVGAERADAFAAVHRAAFPGSAFTAGRWHAPAGGLPYADARSLVAYDGRGDTVAAVAAVAVSSAGPGRPGLLEPMEVHRAHRGHGHGRAIPLAAAAALRDLGSSSAIVCTPSAPTPALFKRWVQFGLLSSHSRLHGSTSYRVPWDYGDEAVAVTRSFTRLKHRLMPYLYGAAVQARDTGTPVMRAMVLEFPDDPSCQTLDRQYMLGDDLLVAPVLSEDGRVDYYVPAGIWTHLLTGERISGPGWRRETHGFDTLPLLARPGAVIPFGALDEGPEYDWADAVTLRVHTPADGSETVTAIPAPDGSGPAAVFTTRRQGGDIIVETGSRLPWNVVLVGASPTGEGVPDPLGARYTCPAGTARLVVPWPEAAGEAF